MADILPPLSFNDWFNQQQAGANTDAGQNSWAGPNQYAHEAYDKYAQYGHLQDQLPLGDPRSLPPGFMQSGYAPAYQSTLARYNDPNYDKSADPDNLAPWLKSYPQYYGAGRTWEDFQHIASQSAQGAVEPDIAQAVLGGAAGVLYGAGVGGGAAAGAGGTGLIDAGTGLPAIDAGAAAGGGAAGGAAPTLGQVGGVLSGGAAAVNAVNGGGGQPAQGGTVGGPNTGGIIGALLGGALGGMQGGNRPAGTTTTTTNQTLAPGGLQQLQNTISGQYLDPATNPYLNQTYDAAARQITPRVNSLFEASGRYGSGAHQGVLGQTLSDLGTNIYGGNYNNERARQLAAAGTSIGSTVQNPYFTNPLAGILSGALAGGVLGGGTNFLGGANGGILNGIGNPFGNSSGTTPGPEQLSGPGSGYTPPSNDYPQELGFGGDMSPSSFRYSPQPAIYPSPSSIESSPIRRVPY
jgi:hypothetical protein